VISEGINTHVTRDVRKVLDPLAMIAERTGAVIFGIAPSTTRAGPTLPACCRVRTPSGTCPGALFGFAKDESQGIRVMTQVKNSLG
jgi:hypothetical protein